MMQSITVSVCAGGKIDNAQSNVDEYNISSLFERGSIQEAKSCLDGLKDHAILENDSRCIEIIQNVALNSDPLGLYAEDILLEIMRNADEGSQQTARTVQECAQRVVSTGSVSGAGKIYDKGTLLKTNVYILAATLLPSQTEENIPHVVKTEITDNCSSFKSTPSGNGTFKDCTYLNQMRDKISYVHEFQNTCPEQCAVYLAEKFGLECEFTDYSNTGQIDVSYPLSLSIPDTDVNYICDDGSSNQKVEQFLSSLKNGAHYLLRTGQNNGSGHNIVLYSENGDWFISDTKYRNLKVASAGQLTEKGAQILVSCVANWGQGEGQSSMAVVEATEEGTRRMIQFIKDCRINDVITAEANQNAWGQDDTA